MTSQRKTPRRDTAVVWACNQILKLASPFTRGMIQGAVNYGLSAAARDSAEGREPPPPWQNLLRSTTAPPGHQMTRLGWPGQPESILSRRETGYVIDGLMLLIDGMTKASPPNDLSELPEIQALMERLMAPRRPS